MVGFPTAAVQQNYSQSDQDKDHSSSIHECQPQFPVVAVDGEETDTQFSGKAGLGIPVSDALSAYGEVSFLTTEDDDDFGLGGKLGLKYNF